MADNGRKSNSLQTIRDILRKGKGGQQVESAKFEDGIDGCLLLMSSARPSRSLTIDLSATFLLLRAPKVAANAPHSSWYWSSQVRGFDLLTECCQRAKLIT
jgi:hypothetical protein